MGISRRNQMLAQYAYAEKQGELVQLANPFASGYHAPEVLIYGKTVAGASVSGGSWNRTGRNLSSVPELLYTRGWQARQVMLPVCGRPFVISFDLDFPAGWRPDYAFFDISGNAILTNRTAQNFWYYQNITPPGWGVMGGFSFNTTTGYYSAGANLRIAIGGFRHSNTDGLAHYMNFGFNSGNAIQTASVRNIQCEFGQEPTAYQPYRGQSIDLTGVTLRGIPVPAGSSNITYTETGGQAWVADSLDLASGELIRRVDGASILPAPVTQFVALADTPKIIPGENNIFVSGSGVAPHMEVKYLAHS